MKEHSTRMLVAIGLSLLLASSAVADEPFDGQTQKWRGLFFTMNVDTSLLETSGDMGVGARELVGLAFYQDGEVATVDAWVSFYVEQGRSHYEGYVFFQFPDGSTQTASLAGCLSPTGAETGEFRFLCGSGRFRGITGTGTFEKDGFSLAGDPFVRAQTTYRLLTE